MIFPAGTATHPRNRRSERESPLENLAQLWSRITQAPNEALLPAFDVSEPQNQIKMHDRPLPEACNCSLDRRKHRPIEIDPSHEVTSWRPVVHRRSPVACTNLRLVLRIHLRCQESTGTVSKKSRVSTTHSTGTGVIMRVPPSCEWPARCDSPRRSIAARARRCS